MADDAVETPRPSVPSGRTLGARLRAAREAMGLSLADISTRTRIPARQLGALEADAHEQLPGLIFAVGFAKSFAREVGLDPDEAAQQFRAETTRPAYAPPAASYDPIEPERVPSRRLAWVSAAAVAAALIGVVIWYQGREPEAVETAVAPAPVVEAAAPAPVPVATVETVPPSAPAGAVDPAAVAAAEPTVAGTPAPVAAPVAVGGTGVTLTAKQDVWVQISDRATGRKVNSQILREGETYQVPPGDLTLWTGRAGAIEVRVGGRPVPPLGGDAETIRDVSLSAGSLLGRAAAAAPIPQVRPTAGSAR